MPEANRRNLSDKDVIYRLPSHVYPLSGLHLPAYVSPILWVLWMGPHPIRIEYLHSEPPDVYLLLLPLLIDRLFESDSCGSLRWRTDKRFSHASP